MVTDVTDTCLLALGPRKGRYTARYLPHSLRVATQVDSLQWDSFCLNNWHQIMHTIELIPLTSILCTFCKNKYNSQNLSCTADALHDMYW